jgi:hypothetical protein
MCAGLGEYLCEQLLGHCQPAPEAQAADVAAADHAVQPEEAPAEEL